MSAHLEATIADCESKIRQLTGLVENLRWFQREFPHSAAAIVPIGPAKAGRKAKRHIKRTNERTNERTKQSAGQR
jgi:hypothetical protein